MVSDKSLSPPPPPLVARIWLQFYYLVKPIKIYLLFTRLNMSFAVLSALFLTTIRLYVAEPILINIFGWPNDDVDSNNKIPTMEAAASMTVSFMHVHKCLPSRALNHYGPPFKHILLPRRVSAILHYCVQDLSLHL